MTYSCLIIGLGQVGMGYDITHNDNHLVLTHCRALSMHPMFEILGAVDPSMKKRSVFEEHYGKKGYKDIVHAMEELSPNLVIISSPTSSHCKVVKEVLDNIKPIAILCEKPLAYNLTDAKEIVQSCEDAGVHLFVNYHRRSDLGVIEIKKRISSGLIESPLKGIVWYSKGFMNNGSHFLNLMLFWLGPVKKYSIISKGRLWNNKDPEPDVYIEFEKGSIIFCSAWEEMFSHYTAEIISASGRIFYDRGGEHIQWQSTINDSKFNEYTILESEPEIIKNNMNCYQYSVIENLFKMLQGKDSSICTGIDALETQKVIHRILEARN
tara:strand:- start:200 stop:1168 length:969 start_codon:yes stop_codon:yes gene_type:complete